MSLEKMAFQKMRKKLLEFFEKASAKGQCEATIKLGEYYQRNDKYDNAILYYKKSIELHFNRELGPGLLESTYEVCLCHELSSNGLKVERQKTIPIFYRGIKLDAGYRLDLVIEDQVIVEIKAISTLLPVHEAQLLSYLKQIGGGRGLLINFNVKLLKHGIRRLII